MVKKIVFWVAMLPTLAVLAFLTFLAFSVHILLGIVALWAFSYITLLQALSEDLERKPRPYQRY